MEITKGLIKEDLKRLLFSSLTLVLLSQDKKTNYQDKKVSLKYKVKGEVQIKILTKEKALI